MKWIIHWPLRKPHISEVYYQVNWIWWRSMSFYAHQSVKYFMGGIQRMWKYLIVNEFAEHNACLLIFTSKQTREYFETFERKFVFHCLFTPRTYHLILHTDRGLTALFQILRSGWRNNHHKNWLYCWLTNWFGDEKILMGGWIKVDHRTHLQTITLKSNSPLHISSKLIHCNKLLKLCHCFFSIDWANWSFR